MSYDLSKIASVARTLEPFSRDCAITVALKITDDSCRMDYSEKDLFMELYDALEREESTLFDEDVFELIEVGRTGPSAQIYKYIKNEREMAMDAITRPKMKAFKAMIRASLRV